MKKLLTISMSLMFVFASCTDFLNMPPKNTKVVYSIEDVKGAMSTFLYGITTSGDWNGYVGSYVRFNGITIQYPFHRSNNIFFAMYTNDIDMRTFIDPAYSGNYDGKPYATWYDENKSWEGYRFAEDLWNGVFNCVGCLNEILKDLDKVPDYDQEVYEQISGEARVIRAYFLLRLNRVFAPFDDNELGIPFNFDAEETEASARWKQTALYDKLIGELTDVQKYQTHPKDTWNIFYNKRIINAILAQTYMFKAESAAGQPGDWEKAEEYAKIARADARVENTVEEQTELTNLTDATVLDRYHPFTLYRRAYTWYNSSNYAPWGLYTWQAAQRATDELTALYDENDIRIEAYFLEQEGELYHRKRYYGRWARVNTTHTLFRISDLMLIEAEALARQGKTSDALELLNSFKQSKIPGYTGYTGSDIIDEILRERRKEFILEEESNWLDMKRMGVAVTRPALDRETNEIETYTLESNDYRYNLPIPEASELRFNNIPQNPGWK